MLPKKPSVLRLFLVGLIISLVLINLTIVIFPEPVDGTEALESVEITEYEGENLSSIVAFRENSIKGPQYIDNETYRLVITGLVDEELEYTYDEVINSFQAFKKVVTLHCVEGWSVTILWEGILLKDLIADAGVDPNEMRLNRVGCFDVGIHCGGWGHIVLEVKIEDRK